MEKKKQYLKIFANFALLGIIIFVCVKLLPFLVDLFMPFIIAAIVAIISEPLVSFLEKKVKIKRKYSAIGIILLILSALASIIYFALSYIYNLILQVIDDWDKIFVQINFLSNKINDIFVKININVDETGTIERISNFANTFAEKFIEITSSFVLNVPLLLFGLVVIIFASYLMIQTHESFLNKLKENERLENIKVQVIDQIFKYCKAQFKIMMIIFVIIAIGLGFLHVQYFLLIAFFIAFIDLLPILGTGTVMIPWTLVDLLYGHYGRAMIIFGIYLIAMIARQILQPKIIGETMEFPAFLTLIFMWVGYKLFGVAGLLLAVPVGIILLRMYKAGIFNVYLDSIKYIVNDIKTFLKIDFK